MPIVGGTITVAESPLANTVVFTSVSEPLPSESLTTIFTPPLSCLTDVYDISGCLLIAPAAQPECYPSSTFLQAGTYSPGICPSGYAAVPVTISTPPAGVSTAQNKTGGICCPYGFSTANIATLNATDYVSLWGEYPCETEWNTPFAIASNEVVQQVNSTSAEVLLTSTITTDPSTTILSSYYSPTTIIATSTTYIRAAGFSIQWDSNDSQILFLLSSLSSSTTTTSGNSTTGTAQPSSSTLGAELNHHGLSGGDIAAIVVPVTLVVLAVVGMMLWIARRRRSKRGLSNDLWQKPELDADAKKPPTELPAESVAVCELHVDPVELPDAPLDWPLPEHRPPEASDHPQFE